MKIRKYLSSFRIIILGFLLVIIIGALLLMLPVSTKGNEAASFSDALFTAVSAVCVTGLVVRDTATYWSMFGQTVIIILIQIGGLGVVTVAMSATVLSGKRIGLMQKSTMQEALAAPNISDVVKMTAFILKTVFLIEFIGAVLLSAVFCREFGVTKGIFYSIFHSISAFCNAGFDLMGVKEEYASMVSYSAQPLINITLMALIIIGGIGFFTWADIKEHKLHIRRYRMQSKVVLLLTGILIILPALYMFFAEFSELPFGERIFVSLFQSVTLRTAGFNSVDFSVVSEVGTAFMIMIMLIGGSPASTAGGMKTTTVAVLFSSAFSVFLKKKEVHFFGRRISVETVRDASTIFLMYIILFLISGMVISAIDGIPLKPVLFETASAIGTVGVTLGITRDLSLISRVILMVLMFFGRVGGLTLIFATFSSKNSNVSKYPQEKITVG